MKKSVAKSLALTWVCIFKALVCLEFKKERKVVIERDQVVPDL